MFENVIVFPKEIVVLFEYCFWAFKVAILLVLCRGLIAFVGCYVDDEEEV